MRSVCWALEQSLVFPGGSGDISRAGAEGAVGPARPRSYGVGAYVDIVACLSSTVVFLLAAPGFSLGVCPAPTLCQGHVLPPGSRTTGGPSLSNCSAHLPAKAIGPEKSLSHSLDQSELMRLAPGVHWLFEGEA